MHLAALLHLLLACATAPQTEVQLPAPIVATPAERYDATVILIAWSGAAKAPAEVRRTEDEARVLAADLAARISTGADPAALAGEHSDHPTAGRNGRLGIVPRGALPAEVESALASVAVGGLAGPLRTDAGWLLLVRREPEVVHVRWVMYGWKGARSSTAKRTTDEARQAALAAVSGLRAGSPLSALAPDASSPEPGELLGRRQWSPPGNNLAFSLEPGEVSVPIETWQGWLVVHRVR